MYARMSDLAQKVTLKLGQSWEASGADQTAGSDWIYRVQVGAYTNRENAEKKLRQISATGTDCFVTDMQGGYYRVQCGAYTIRGNAERKAAELKNMGFDAIIKEYKL